MFGSIGQNWRQIMQMPQRFSFPVGGLFPTRMATGGWRMGAPSMPQAPGQTPAPSAPAAAQQADPFANHFAPEYAKALQALQGYAQPGFGLGGLGIGGMAGGADIGSAGKGMGGYGYGGSADIGGMAW